MNRRLRWYWWVLLGPTCLFLLLASHCNNRRCQVSSDCPGTQICGPGGRCVLRCQTSRDCHQFQRCVEGSCQDIK